MKTDLATIIVTAIVGLAGGYFLCNILLPSIEGVSFRTIDVGGSYDVAEPDPEIFNYRALNPTVEVYVGSCQAFNENGECIDDMINAGNLNTVENNEDNQ